MLVHWHVWGGRAVIGLVLVHDWAATAAWAEIRQLDVTPDLSEVVQLPRLPAATLAAALRVGVTIVSARSARRRLGHERWHALQPSEHLGAVG